MSQPAPWSGFVYPPQQSNPALNFTTQDAVNVSWTTPSGNENNFETLELIYWWSTKQPYGSNAALVVNETVPLNGSRIFSTGYGLNFPAFGWFALFYLRSDGSVVNGPASLGFNVIKASPPDPGRLWTEDGSDTTLSSPAEQSSIPPPAPTATVTVPPQPAISNQSSSNTSTPNTSGSNSETNGLNGGAIAGIILGTISIVCMIILGIFISMRRARRRIPDASVQYIGNQIHEKTIGLPTPIIAPPRAKSGVFGGELDFAERTPLPPIIEKDGRQQRCELPARRQGDYTPVS